MSRTVTLACCALNQWALDFHGNLQRILESIKVSKERGAVYRLGPELEVCGYGCGDHFLESDTILLCLESLANLLQDPITNDIICDIGMPVMHKNVLYNCHVIFYNKTILLIRPKICLAMDGNYREMRWFTPWTKIRQCEDFYLPSSLADITGQIKVSFGDGVISTVDTVLGSETCEELFTANSPHIAMGLDGVEIFMNGSGSHHELRKLHKRVDLIKSATTKVGGVYMYSNLIGCDGERVYYDGCCLIAVNGEIVAQGSQFTLREVEVTTATVDLNDVRSFRGSCMSRGMQTSTAATYPRIHVNVAIAQPLSINNTVSCPHSVKYLMPEEEISLGPACWLWDYLRRSGLTGYLLPLSGGLDSASVATIVGSMCRLVVTAINEGCGQVINDVRRILDNEPLPNTPTELAKLIFTTCYMKTVNSSSETETCAARLAEQIGSTHISVAIDNMVDASIATVSSEINMVPKFKVHGGSEAENIALQNVQARNRMVLAYLFAQLLPWSRGHGGTLLVLASANVDECLRGYMTKYDCSSADLNPIGSISKTDLRSFCKFMSPHYPELSNILKAKPTAELEPITESHVQNDEDDMGMTYAELSVFGRLRKVYHCGPYSMFVKLVHMWGNKLTPTEVASKVKHFFRCYGNNRHKMTVLPPSYHAETYSPDDNRYDLRPFLYNSTWQWQFELIDRELVVMEKSMNTEFQTVLSDRGDIEATPTTNEVEQTREEEDAPMIEEDNKLQDDNEMVEEEEEEESDYKGWKRTPSYVDDEYVTAVQSQSSSILLPFEGEEKNDDLVVIDSASGDDVIPTGDDVTPTGDDVTPTGDDVTPTTSDGSRGNGRSRGRRKRRGGRKKKATNQNGNGSGRGGGSGGRGGQAGGQGRGGQAGGGQAGSRRGMGRKRLANAQRPRPQGTPYPMANVWRHEEWTPGGGRNLRPPRPMSLNALLQTPSSLINRHVEKPSAFERLGPNYSTPSSLSYHDEYSHTPSHISPYHQHHPHPPPNPHHPPNPHPPPHPHHPPNPHHPHHPPNPHHPHPPHHPPNPHSHQSFSDGNSSGVARQQSLLPPSPSWFSRLLHRR